MAIYTCVLLDVDNTILDFDAAERQALTDMLAEYELPHDEAAYDTYHKVNRELWDSLAKGQLNKQKLFQIRFSRFMQTMQLPDNGKGKAMNDRYEELLATHADLLPGALTALEELSEVATLALVSNGAIAVQESRIAASGIDRYMDGIYISEKVGAAKPSAKLFEHAFRDLGITNKSRVLMVGDDLLADIKGGLNAGVDTCWFNPGNLENKSGITPKYTVSSYEELYRIVMEPEELGKYRRAQPPPQQRSPAVRRGRTAAARLSGGGIILELRMYRYVVGTSKLRQELRRTRGTA